jgi:serine phosphatase RsbU (regulator of sigma subunit)
MAKKTQRQIEIDEQIYQITTLVAGQSGLQEVLDRLAEAAVRIVGVKACSIRLLDGDSGDLKMRSTYGLSEEYRNKGPVTKDDPVIRQAFAGEAVVLDDMRVDKRVTHPEATIKEGLVSQLTVAMVFRGQPIGVLRLYSPTPKRFYEDDVNLARAVASQCAIAITNAGLYAEAIEGARIAEQMRLAGVIQRRMLPEKSPQVPGLDIAATYIPCFDVGGDFYDFIELSDGRLVIVIADVIGKGIPAAIMTSSFRGALRAYSECECRPGGIIETVRKLNRMACTECRPGEFVSLFYSVINPETRELTYCNCGHEPAILIRNGQSCDLDSGGMVLGVHPDAQYKIDSFELKDGDRLLYYTDGLIDAQNFNGEIWGREQMLEAVVTCDCESAEQMMKDILRYRRRFVGLAHQVDDTSLVAVKAGNCRGE